MSIGTQRGFTFTELLIVITVVGVLGALSMSFFFNQMPKYRLNKAVTQLSWDLARARVDAVSQQRSIKVSFFPGNHEYRICYDTSNCAVNEQVKHMHTSIDLSSNNDPIFSPRGTATNLPTITLTNSNADSKDITISSAGRIKVN